MIVVLSFYGAEVNKRKLLLGGDGVIAVVRGYDEW